MPRQSTELLKFSEYDTIIVSYSGGKDSLACLLYLLEQGVERAKIELWHQHVDGAPGGDRGLMDWPVTEAYVNATGSALGIKVKFQWRDGGFEREMLRDNQPTGDVYFQGDDPDASPVAKESNQKKLGTRKKFPQVSADLSVRWCSAYLKIDVAARTINNTPELKEARILYITGERREESPARSKYLEKEKHRCNNKSRRVDHWRPVIDWDEAQVWEIIKRWKVAPHPAYKLGWGRVSCLACIFGDRHQWASVGQISRDRYERISAYEKTFGCTIQRAESIEEQASRGESFIPEGSDELIALALGKKFSEANVFEEDWKLPAGSFKSCGGPN